MSKKAWGGRYQGRMEDVPLMWGSVAGHQSLGWINPLRDYVIIQYVSMR